MLVNSFKPSKQLKSFDSSQQSSFIFDSPFVSFISSKRAIWIEISKVPNEVNALRMYVKWAWNTYFKLYVIQSQEHGTQFKKCNSQSLFQL